MGCNSFMFFWLQDLIVSFWGCLGWCAVCSVATCRPEGREGEAWWLEMAGDVVLEAEDFNVIQSKFFPNIFQIFHPSRTSPIGPRISRSASLPGAIHQHTPDHVHRRGVLLRGARSPTEQQGTASYFATNTERLQLVSYKFQHTCPWFPRASLNTTCMTWGCRSWDERHLPPQQSTVKARRRRTSSR